MIEQFVHILKKKIMSSIVEIRHIFTRAICWGIQNKYIHLNIYLIWLLAPLFLEKYMVHFINLWWPSLQLV